MLRSSLLEAIASTREGSSWGANERPTKRPQAGQVEKEVISIPYNMEKVAL